MDQKIHMSEILDLIFAHIGEDEPGVYFSRKERSRKLALLARTCRTFQNPALDALWQFQDNLAPALRCFPDDLWDRSADSKKTTFVGFRRPLVLSDWERPFFYWNRIKSFQIRSLTTTTPAVCEMLRLCCPGPHLFANLQEIAWLHRDLTHFPIFSIFLSPRLHTIGLALSGSIAELSILPRLSVCYPTLTEVNFRSIYRTHLEPRALGAIFAFLSSLTRLESLYLPNIDAPILNHVSRLPCLRTLVMDDSEPFDFSSDRDRSAPRFHALKKLNVWATTPKLGTRIMRAIESGALTEIHLVFESQFPSSQATARLYTTIASNGSHSTLQSLRVEDEWKFGDIPIPLDEEFDNYIVGGGTLEILFPFANLTTVILKPFHGFDLDDEMVAKMAHAWRRVQELRVAFGIDWHIPDVRTPRVTLAGIYTVATHCLDLHTLELYFNSSVIPPLERTHTHAGLVKLDVLCSPISSPTAVAQFLSKVFPNLREIHSICYAQDRHQRAVEGRWRKVARLITGSTIRSRFEESTDEEPSDTDYGDDDDDSDE
ncbi:hypothetical protein MVEN_01096800 [Mycena venus]|uniref:F-box domain-containing protein n=1 Tax=Mycena venus TaxID=2733690 RepID=A0A8H6Y945_9AGAR|nr:hypothetical protein MVEN_01096800 [Mycena venus]